MTFPLALRLEGKKVVVVGGGPIALEKARPLAAAGAALEVVAPEVRPELAAIACKVHVRAFAAEDLDGAWLAFAAAPPPVNRAVKIAADARQLFLVSVDDVEACSAFGLARLERGDVAIAIGTGGRAPALAALLRRALDRIIPEDVEAWARTAAAARTREGTPEERRARLRDLLLAEIR